VNTIDDLRTALGDKATPAGVDVRAVRRRAGRQRGWLVAGTAVAVLAVTFAVALPLRTTEGGAPPARPSPTPPAAAADCPRSYPRDLHNSGPGLAAHLVPMAIDAVVACEYHGSYLSRQPTPPAAFMYLTASRQLRKQDGRALVDLLERAAPRHPAGCETDGASMLLQVTGGGRTVSLRVDPFGCGIATNGHTTRFGGPAATTSLLALLAGTPPRLACPATPDADEWAAPRKGQTHILPFLPDRLIMCRYGPMPGTRLTPDWTHELDGPDAREFVRILDAEPEFAPAPCPTRSPAYRYEVVLSGEGQRAVLTGSDNGCVALGNSRRVVDVDWDKLLSPGS
jgi:hypothetical protein